MIRQIMVYGKLKAPEIAIGSGNPDPLCASEPSWALGEEMTDGQTTRKLKKW